MCFGKLILALRNWFVFLRKMFCVLVNWFVFLEIGLCLETLFCVLANWPFLATVHLAWIKAREAYSPCHVEVLSFFKWLLQKGLACGETVSALAWHTQTHIHGGFGREFVSYGRIGGAVPSSLISSIGVLLGFFGRGASFFSSSLLVEFRASRENTGWLASRDASCINSTKFSKEYWPHLALVFFALSLRLLL